MKDSDEGPDATASLWRPIESAPTDGTVVLVTPGCEVGSDVYTWPEGATVDVLPARWHEPNARTDEAAGWYPPMFSLSFGPWDDPSTDIDAIRLDPTHWMPLPEPPK